MSGCIACSEGKPCTGPDQPSCSDGSCGVSLRNPPASTSDQLAAQEVELMAAYNRGRQDVDKGKEVRLFLAAGLGAASVYALVRWGVIK